MPFTEYKITSPFGMRKDPFTSQSKFHAGIDLVKPHKAPIEAFTEGQVLYAGMGQTGTGFGGYGIVVFIKDKNGRGHVYAHLDSVAIKKGDVVKKSQVIGCQGNTGQSTGSHLHYEVRKKAEDKVPYGWESDRENNCLEPMTYLKGYFEKEVVKVANIENDKNAKPSPALAKEFKRAVELGITDGTYPKRLATREEVAVMIVRAMDRK